GPHGAPGSADAGDAADSQSHRRELRSARVQFLAGIESNGWTCDVGGGDVFWQHGWVGRRRYGDADGIARAGLSRRGVPILVRAGASKRRTGAVREER